MEELIAKRYIGALKSTTSSEAFESIASLFDVLSKEYADEKLQQILLSPSTSKEDKRSILVEAVKSSGSKEAENLLSLLVENGRINIIPAMAVEMRKEIARQNNSFSGKVYSDAEMDEQTISGLSAGLSKKVGSEIVLAYIKSDFDGVKVEVEDLGIEINFSKNRLNSQLIEHILKAI